MERTNFVTNGWSVFTELDAEWKPIKRLVKGYGIVASEDVIGIDTTDSNNYHFYHQNEHGDVEYITGSAGKFENAYTYDAFGNITNSEKLIRNRYTYNGEQYDTTTSQYYLRARYYNPLVGRFTQEDVYRGDGLNLYAYCGANPVMYVDPSGYESKCEIGSESGLNSGFTDAEIQRLKQTVIDEGQALKDLGLTNQQLGPAIAGAYDKSTGKIYTAINDLYGNIPSELSPYIAKRINDMPQSVIDSYIATRGAGSHAEVYAVNKLLLDNPNAKLSDIAVYVNRTLGVSKPVIEIPFKTCPHCLYILDGIYIISN